MKNRTQLEARVIRSLVAAIDNAEVPTVPAEQTSSLQHQFEHGTAEVERLRLTWPQVHDALRNELQERERAASEFDRLNKQDHAETLREEARVIERYLV
jgi:uncharacterized protein YqeY